MYVCICRAVTASRIRRAIADGASTVDAVEACCGAGGDCGTCRDEIDDMIVEAHGSGVAASGCDGCPRGRDRGQSAGA